MRYFVVSDDGNKYGPADVPTLNSWVQEGRIVPGTLLEEESSGARVAASAVAGLVFGGEATGARPQQQVYTNAPSAAQQNPYSAGYAQNYAPSTPGGQTETIISWVCGVVGLVCCCVGWLFGGIGIALAASAKGKGSSTAQAALIFNIVVVVFSLCVLGIRGPLMMDGFRRGFNQSQLQVR